MCVVGQCFPRRSVILEQGVRLDARYERDTFAWFFRDLPGSKISENHLSLGARGARENEWGRERRRDAEARRERTFRSAGRPARDNAMQWKSSATPYRGLVYTNHRPMEAIILICWSSIEPLSSFRSRIIKVAHRREQARSLARRVRAGVALELSQNCARATGVRTNISRFFPIETSSSFRVSSAVGSAHVREAIRRKELGFDRSPPT